MSAAVTITKENFENEVRQSSTPVLLDFWAEWCSPCRMLAPTIEEIARERSKIKVGQVNIDEQQELAAAFGVMSIPTVLLISNGKTVGKSIGAKPKEQLLAMIDSVM